MSAAITVPSASLQSLCLGPLASYSKHTDTTAAPTGGRWYCHSHQLPAGLITVMVVSKLGAEGTKRARRINLRGLEMISRVGMLKNKL